MDLQSLCQSPLWKSSQIKFCLYSPKLQLHIFSLSFHKLYRYDILSPQTLQLGDEKLKKKNPNQKKTGKIRHFRKNHRGCIFLPWADRCAVNVTCTEHNNMITTSKSARVYGFYKSRSMGRCQIYTRKVGECKSYKSYLFY